MKIVIFDSGVGGLTIFQAVRRVVPSAQLVFVSDTAAYPYGNKTETFVRERVLQVAAQLMQEIQPDLFVVACNTASTVVLPSLRQVLPIPVVGVVPAIKPAAQQSKTQHIGVLATPATVKRSYTQDLIQQFAPHCQVDLLGSTELVNLSEQKARGVAVNQTELQAIMQPWLSSDKCTMDTIVLACTHFPWLRSELEMLFSQHQRTIHWVDSAQGIAKRVGQLSGVVAEHNGAANPRAIFIQESTEKEFSSPPFSELLNSLGIMQLDCLVVPTS